jgi:hypothetical protein
MSDWVPILVGFLIIAIAVVIMRVAPHSAWSQELRRSYGARPTGERGHRTRHDHLRSAGLGGVAAVALLVTAIVAGSVADRAPDDTRANVIALTYMLVALLLGVMAVASAARSLWKAAAWRVELPDTPEYRRALADALDHLLDGDVSPQERHDYLDVSYVQPQLEQIRRATLKLVKQHTAGVPDDYRTQIKRWTAGIRASAGPSASPQGGPRE